jgi:oxygen-independent coproporphyrinogen-3 oxidase
MNEQGVNEGSVASEPPSATETSSGQLDRLRAKYDVRGPRYTSYPPANHFGPVDLTELRRRWLLRNEGPDNQLSLYVHVPFCRSRCLFCGCHTYACADQTALATYVDALIAEIELVSHMVSPGRRLGQVALGGGTPTSLPIEQLARLLDAVEGQWRAESGAECSAEIDARTVTMEQLDFLLSRGFSRFSLGVQDLSPAVLRSVGRPQTGRQVREIVGHLRGRGCDQINFDLIYGLPGQDLDTAAETAQQVVELRPSRVALYSYAHVPWLRPHQKALEKYDLPSGELKVALFRRVADALLAAGYRAIGMDHFALPDDGLALAQDQGRLRRNFMGYTTGKGLDVLGVGASAISSMGSTYAQDYKELEDYLSAVGRGEWPIQRGFLLSPEDELRRELLQDLSCNFRADFAALSRLFGGDLLSHWERELEALKPLIDDELVEWQGQTLIVTDVGRLFVRNVCMVFDQYLAQVQQQTYSRTV